MKTNKTLFVFIGAGLLLFLYLLLVASVLLRSYIINFVNSQTDTIPTYALEENSEYIVVWNRTDISTNPDNRRPGLVGGSGRIIVNGRKNEPLALWRIHGLDSISGETVWEASESGSGQIIIEGEYLYLGTVGDARVISYAIDNGELVWNTSLPWAHSVLEIYSVENKIFIYTNDFEFFVLNTNGVILSNSSDESFRVFLEMNDLLYMESLLAIKAVDVSSRQEVWSLKLGSQYTHSPIFSDGTIFLRTWNGSDVSIYSIDQMTGAVNWKVSANAISNLYVARNKLYYMSWDGYLVSVDKNTGNEISRVKFLPEIDTNATTGGFSITGDVVNDIIAVTFAGNDQIMGIKVLNP
jgi:outer membrane protein assembly factor BamB